MPQITLFYNVEMIRNSSSPPPPFFTRNDSVRMDIR